MRMTFVSWRVCRCAGGRCAAAGPASAVPASPAEAAPNLVPAAAPPAPAAPTAAPQPKVELVSLESLRSALGDEAVEALQIVKNIWNIGLVWGTDKDKPIVTVGTLCGGIVLLGLGYLAAGIISRWVASKLLTRFGLRKSGVSPLQSITFYVLLATFTMLSLNVLNVPMTVFSFLGGALAIGAGFGSQNIVNNFISGLILLAERPIRVGDVIQLDGMTGTVTQIGARSTKIATGAEPRDHRPQQQAAGNQRRQLDALRRHGRLRGQASARLTARPPARSSGC